MNSPRWSQKLIGVLIATMFLAGCGAPTATPGSVTLSDATATTTQASSLYLSPGRISLGTWCIQLSTKAVMADRYG